MQNPDQRGIGAQVDKMRAEIRPHGESRVGCGELSLLRPNEVADAQGSSGIAEIAEWERWTFEYLPDGSVRFTSLWQGGAILHVGRVLSAGGDS
jgi:hypothetical protein